MPKSKIVTCLLGLLLFLALSLPHYGEAATYLAFSLNEAQRQLATIEGSNPKVLELGGINHPIGVVYDREQKDLILVGQTISGNGKVTLDDLVVSMRAIFIHHQSPRVSIDKTEKTRETGRQIVRFEGGVEHTKFGKDFLEADVILKKVGLGLQRLDIWGIPSYYDLYRQYWEKGGAEDFVRSRFWFKGDDKRSYVAVREGVAVIDKLVMKVETELQAATIDGNAAPSGSNIRDKVGDEFASALTSNYDDISAANPEVKRLDTLFRLVSLSTGIQQFGVSDASFKPNTDYWLKSFQVRKVETATEYSLLSRESEVNRNGKTFRMVLDGGVELKALVIGLRDGEATAFRDLVVKSRPKGNQLIWEVPLGGWNPSGIVDESDRKGADPGIDQKGLSESSGLGMSLSVQISQPGSSTGGGMKEPATAVKSSPTVSGLLGRQFKDNLPSQRVSPEVGGVMLQGTASVAGTKEARVELGKGQFSLIVDGKDAQLDPQAFRKFVTALWAVYFSRIDPGISIDPIEWGGKQHLVRYIGRVINTDLGRVMRDADYLMKQWAVGASRPNVQGFMNPDDISGRRGSFYYGVSSRFWFVPEDMRFKEGNGMLLYDSGRMRVKTEFNLQNGRAMKADPSNEQFANFLTGNYDKLSQQYPVLKDLLDYAKLVQLAKYLKENNVPLFWFLMANKDLVLTEDSPGTVDALAKGSDYFKNIHLEGGVDLATRGQYVFDQAAVTAINQALSRHPADGPVKTSLGAAPAYVPGNFSFDLKGQSYSTVPQSSLTSGKDRRGIRYQTDLAVRAEGFELSDQALESLRPEILRREIGNRLRPVIEGMSENELKVKYEGLLRRAIEESKGGVDSILARLAALKNKEHRSEVEFSGAVERAIGSEAVRRFGDLIVRQAHYVANLELVRYFHPQRGASEGEFGAGWHFLIPYRVKPAGPEKQRFQNYLLPAKMEVLNLFSGEKEVLTFSEDRYSIAGYVPDKVERSQVVGLFLFSDGSYRLADKLGSEFQFDQGGNLTEMIFSEDRRTKIEYGFIEIKTERLFELRPDLSQYETFQHVRLPKRMVLREVSTGKDEVLVANRENSYGIIGYTPENDSASRYRFLALMSDGSFALSDKEDGETYFDPSGKWTRTRFKAVTALSQGQFRIEFKHDFKAGKPRIVEARVMRQGRPTPMHTAKYEYGQDQRLSRVVTASSGS